MTRIWLHACRTIGPLALLFLASVAIAHAETAGSGPAEEEAYSAVDRRLYIYGYFSTRLEKTLNEPTVDDGRVVSEEAPFEWSHPFVNLMLQNRLSKNFKAFMNLNGSGAGQIDVRNLWGEYSASQRFNVRMGKVYRHFGLYNEILDAVPTYFGIEPPELFDSDHLIVSRTTTLMVYGELPLGTDQLRYTVNTDHGEGGPALGTFPIGGDLRLTSGEDRYIVGASFYASNGETIPDLSVGEGSPKSGVLPWMGSDDFKVFGGYGQLRIGSLTVQAEYWRAPHEARRDPASVVEMIQGGKPNSAQLSRFLVDPTKSVSEENVAAGADFTVETGYVRAGYSQETEIGRIEPYLQWDWYRNPETIASKKFGGDNEAGVTDDGEFHKATIGVVFRPIAEVAIKLDGSSHLYRFQERRVHYEEIRFDVSIVFGQ